MNEELKIVQTSVVQKERYFQVDLLKSLMMVLVIMDHSFTHNFLRNYYAPLWQRIAIPMLMIIMGFNYGISHKNWTPKQMDKIYSMKYFKEKIRRYVFPFMILYLIHFGLYIVSDIFYLDRFNITLYDDYRLRFLGFTFFWGPGEWFIPMLMGTIVFLPWLYKTYKSSPFLMFVVYFIAEMLVQLMVYVLFLGGGQITKFFFFTNFCFFFSALALGFWISDHQKLLEKKNIIIWILAILSLYYLINYSLGFRFIDRYGRPRIAGDYNYLVYPYSALLFLICLNVIPKDLDNKFAKFIRLVSNSTYHILLAQILYFSMIYQWLININFIFDFNPINYLWYYPLNLLITFTAGIFWYKMDNKLHLKMKETGKESVSYKLLIWLSNIYFLGRYILLLGFFSM